MRIGSLFSGAGGLDLAALELFPRSSMAWHCEVDTAASKVLAHHWPDVPNLGDVTTVDWSAIEPVDVLTGGYPCQPFSAAGKRKGTNDERHLWPYVRKAIRHLRPRFTLLENVAGHRSLGFDRVLADLAADGVDAEWCSVRASDVGAAHRRERLFILAVLADAAGKCGEDWEVRSSGEQVVTLVGASDGDHAGGVAAGVHQLGGSAAVVASPVALLPTPNASDGTGGGQHPDKRTGHSQQLIDYALAHGTPQWGKYEAAIRRQELSSRPAPAPTELGARGNPRLSAAFAEWLMFWPAGWVTDPAIGLSRNDQLRIIGNGVVPPQAVAAFRHLRSMCEVAV